MSYHLVHDFIHAILPTFIFSNTQSPFLSPSLVGPATSLLHQQLSADYPESSPANAQAHDQVQRPGRVSAGGATQVHSEHLPPTLHDRGRVCQSHYQPLWAGTAASTQLLLGQLGEDGGKGVEEMGCMRGRIKGRGRGRGGGAGAEEETEISQPSFNENKTGLKLF